MGRAHLTYCEDFLLAEGIGRKSLLCAVLDGCSMGKDAHFSSALFGKLLRMIAHEITLESKKDQGLTWDESQPETLAREVLRRLFKAVRKTRKQLHLEYEELLTTVLLWVHHYETQRSFVISLGDGVVSCDGQVHIIDQNNRPDYLAYHLKKDFKTWYAQQQHTFHFEAPKDLCIATDGVETFRPHAKEFVNEENLTYNALPYLMVEATHPEAENMLDQKLEVLRKKGLAPVDDLALIRAQFDQ